MQFKHIAASLLVAALVVGLVAPRATAQLEAAVQESGNISISSDGNGNNAPSGQLQVQKPAGATVRGAYLCAASNFNRVINNGDVSLAGVPLNWDDKAFNGFPGNETFFHNVFDNVTAIVKPIVDAAPAGLVNITVTEVDTGSIDGTVLTVIFDDPNVTANSSIILLFGGQATAGETFVINLAEPLDLTDPGSLAIMGLGISFSFQGTTGTTMISEIDVNGFRLTSSAGGEDDGAGENGALLTAGGIGDSTANPPPFAPSTGFATDDELYDLLPFVDTGDMSITVATLNPSDDDNIFCGYFVTSVPAAIGESILLSPLAAVNEINTSHTVTATVVDDNNNPVVGRNVDFLVTAGPNAGDMGSDLTDAAGQATFTYVGDGGIGIDTLIATMINSAGDPQTSNTATKEWQNPAECFLLFGSQSTDLVFGKHNDHLLLLPLWYTDVTLDDIPLFTVPNAPVLQGLHVYFQVFMKNFIDFPEDPIKFSNGVDIMLGGPAVNYGPTSGMGAWSQTATVPLGGTIDVKFAIFGFNP